MMCDAAVRDFRDFDEIDLIAVWRDARVFPDKLPPVREEQSGAVPASEHIGQLAQARGEERPDLGVSAQDSFGAVAQRGDHAAYAGTRPARRGGEQAFRRHAERLDGAAGAVGHRRGRGFAGRLMRRAADGTENKSKRS